MKVVISACVVAMATLMVAAPTVALDSLETPPQRGPLAYTPSEASWYGALRGDEGVHDLTEVCNVCFSGDACSWNPGEGCAQAIEEAMPDMEGEAASIRVNVARTLFMSRRDEHVESLRSWCLKNAPPERIECDLVLPSPIQGYCTCPFDSKSKPAPPLQCDMMCSRDQEVTEFFGQFCRFNRDIRACTFRAWEANDYEVADKRKAVVWKAAKQASLEAYAAQRGGKTASESILKTLIRDRVGKVEGASLELAEYLCNNGHVEKVMSEERNAALICKSEGGAKPHYLFQGGVPVLNSNGESAEDAFRNYRRDRINEVVTRTNKLRVPIPN